MSAVNSKHGVSVWPLMQHLILHHDYICALNSWNDA